VATPQTHASHPTDLIAESTGVRTALPRERRVRTPSSTRTPMKNTPPMKAVMYVVSLVANDAASSPRISEGCHGRGCATNRNTATTSASVTKAT